MLGDSGKHFLCGALRRVLHVHLVRCVPSSEEGQLVSPVVDGKQVDLQMLSLREILLMKMEAAWVVVFHF